VDLHDLLVPVLQQLTQLKHLALSTAKLDLACFQGIASMGQLERLELTNRCVFGLPHLSLLHRCSALAEIDLTGCCFADEDEMVMAMLLPKAGLRRLAITEDNERHIYMRDRLYNGATGSNVPKQVADFLGVELVIR
jgi:hypothetical protein